MLNEQAAKIKQTLEDQGFKVTKLEVQTGIAKDNQNAWQSPEQHNMAREQRESAERMRSGQRLLQGGMSDLSGDDDGFVPPTLADRAQGLDLFA
jgi:flagellar hook-length control protein FliK